MKTKSKTKAKPKKLKLFVWHNVLTDYSDGVMFAFARDVDHARKVIKKSHPNSFYKDGSADRDLMTEPTVYAKPTGFAVWGGG